MRYLYHGQDVPVAVRQRVLDAVLEGAEGHRRRAELLVLEEERRHRVAIGDVLCVHGDGRANLRCLFQNLGLEATFHPEESQNICETLRKTCKF